MASLATRATEGEIDRIRSLGLEDLRREWRRLNHSEPPKISRDLLVLALGYRLQEIAMAINACYLNNGQACIAASRLIVPEDRLDEVKRLAKAAVEKIKMGDPRDKDVTLGPLASTKQYKRVQEYIKSGIEEGAELVIGGEGHPQGLEGGNFIKPTVFANVTREMRIAKEEIFGPVLSILTYKTEAEAIEIANDTNSASSPT